MNYTENYHLPQWDEADRIMRVDFNDAMEKLETGLTGSVQAAQNACQNSDTLDKKTLHRLRRMAYNHYSAVQDMNPFPRQVGVFHQNPAKDGSGVTGTALWNGICFAARSSADITQVSLLDYLQEEAPMTLVKNDLAACTPLKVNICPPVSGYMNKITLCAIINDYTPNTPFSIRVSLVNLDTGETEVSHLLSVSFEITGGMASNRFDCYLPFHALQHYQIQIQPLAAVYNGDMRISPDDRSTPFIMISNNRPITATHTMRELEGSTGGLLIVRGLVHGGTLTVKWDGQAVPLQTIRSVRTPDGRMVKEMVYFRDGSIPAETTFSLQYDLNGYSSFLFYDWGAVLL